MTITTLNKFSYLQICAERFQVVLDASLGVNGEVEVTKHRPRERKVTTRVWELTSSVAQVHASRRINTRQWGQTDVWQSCKFWFLFIVFLKLLFVFWGSFYYHFRLSRQCYLRRTLRRGTVRWVDWLLSRLGSRRVGDWSRPRCPGRYRKTACCTTGPPTDNQETISRSP